MSTQRELEEVPRPDDGVIPPSIHSWMRETAVGKFVLSLVQNKRLKLQDIRTLTESPPVAGDHWRIVAPAFGLDPGSQLPLFSVPRAYLPPSFQRQIMMSSIEWLNTSASVRMRHINAVYSIDIFIFCVFTLSFSGLSLCAPYFRAVWSIRRSLQSLGCHRPGVW